MLATAVFVVAVLMSDAQSLETPALVRGAGTSAPLAKRFATLFPVGSSSTAAPAPPLRDFSPHNRLEDPRRLHQDRQEIICGLRVIRKSADIDPRIIIPRNDAVVPAARRIEPDVCQPADTGRK